MLIQSHWWTKRRSKTVCCAWTFTIIFPRTVPTYPIENRGIVLLSKLYSHAKLLSNWIYDSDVVWSDAVVQILVLIDKCDLVLFVSTVYNMLKLPLPTHWKFDVLYKRHKLYFDPQLSSFKSVWNAFALQVLWPKYFPINLHILIALNRFHLSLRLYRQNKTCQPNIFLSFL